MSSRRSIIMLLAGIGLLVAAHFAVDCSGNGVVTAESRRVLVPHADEAVRIEVSRGGRRQVGLERSEGDWRVVAPFSDSADVRVVKRLLDALAFVPVVDAISDAEILKRGRDRADFATGAVTVSVASSDGRREEASFGSSTPDAAGVYATVSGVDAVFIVPASVLAAADIPPDGFRSRGICATDPMAVSSFDVRRGSGGVASFVREGDGWSAKGGVASSQKVKKFLSDVTAAEAVGFVWPSGSTNDAATASESLLAGFGLDPESAITVTLKEIGGYDRQLSFGKPAGENLVYALVRGGTVVVTVASSLKDAVAPESGLLADSRLFPAEARSVTAFTIADGAVSCALARGTGADASWRLESPVAAPADCAVVDELLARLLALSPAEADETGLSIAIPAGSKPVVVSRASALGDVRIEDLRSKEIAKIDTALVKRLVSTSGGSSIAVVYARDRRVWSVEAEGGPASADEKSIAAVLAALNPLVAVRVERLKASASELAAYGLDEPFLTLAVDQDREDAVRRNVILGARAPDGGRYATVGSADAVFVISDAVVESLSRKLAD